MRVSEIKTHDPSFGPYTCRLAEDFQFITLSALDEIKPNSITFVKNRRLLQQFLDSAEQQKLENNYLLVEEQLLPSLRMGGELATLTELFSGVGVVASVDLAMSYLSRPFYLRQLEQRNTMVDGRQMGTAVIHPTAQIAQQVFIGEQVKIAQEVTLYPGVVIMAIARLGRAP